MSEERDFESEARRGGWVPEEEWNGPSDAWKPAQQFVEDGEKYAGVLKSKNKDLESKVEELSNRVDSLLQSNEKINQWSQQQQKKAEAEKQELIKELKQQRKQAVAEGDGDAFDDADEKLKELDGFDSKTGESEIPLSPEAETWLNANRSWYGKNEDLTVFADAISDKVIAQGYTPQSAAYFAELDRRVKERFPDEFENPNRKKASTVDSGEPAGSKGKTFNDLPDDAKKAFDRFKKDIPGFTKDQYLATYDWEQDNA